MSKSHKNFMKERDDALRRGDQVNYPVVTSIRRDENSPMQLSFECNQGTFTATPAMTTAACFFSGSSCFVVGKWLLKIRTPMYVAIPLCAAVGSTVALSSAFAMATKHPFGSAWFTSTASIVALSVALSSPFVIGNMGTEVVVKHPQP